MALKENEIIDLESMEIRPMTPEEIAASKPEAPAAEKKEEPKTEAEEPEAKKEETTDKEEETEEEESEEKDEEKEEPAKVEAKKEEKKQDDDDEVSVDDFLSEKYAEKYKIQTEEDLDAHLAAIEEIQTENETLRAELAEAKKGKPTFASEQEEKAFEFLKTFDVSRIGDGMETMAKVITMDVNKADPKILLEERFILENPELTREEALKKFNRDYNRKYTLKREDFDGDDAAFKEEEEQVRIDLKLAVGKAKDYLSKKQVELKAKPKEVEEPVVKERSAAIQRGIKENVSELDDFMGEFNEFIFSPTDKDSDNFKYKLTKEQKKLMRETCAAWIGNPNSYDAKGKLIDDTEDGEFNVEKKIQQVARLLFGDDMIEKAYKHGLSVGEIKRVDEVAKKQPDRVAKGGAANLGEMSEEEQWAEIEKKQRAEASKRRQFA